MVNNETARDLGPWQNADLVATTKADAGVGADASVPPPVRFLSNVTKLVRRRHATTDRHTALRYPAIFLLQPSPPREAKDSCPKRVPMLDNGLHELNGRVWFVGAGPASGHFIPFQVDDDDELFKFITDVLKLGQVPAIVLDPRLGDAILRHYPNGLIAVDDVEHITFSTTDVTFPRVASTVDHTYQEKMKTPDAQPLSGKLWKNSRKCWPHRDAEQRVQLYLEVALNAAFPTCTVRSEQSMPEGRLDIEIFEHEPTDRSKITQHCVLELKVLRTLRESGTPVPDKETAAWVTSGVEQAGTYRASRGSKWSALICFDMRRENLGDKLCFKHVKRLAHQLEVHLRRWFIYRSSAELRKALPRTKT